MVKKESNVVNEKKDSDERLKKLPKEVQEKLKTIKTKLDKFSKDIVKKFDKYIMGVALLPPPKPQKIPENGPEQKNNVPKIDPNKIHILVLIDDTDSKKMTKEELKSKLTTIIENIEETAVHQELTQEHSHYEPLVKLTNKKIGKRNRS